jgi:hypothetical protein
MPNPAKDESRVICIHLVDGTPGSIRTGEITDYWTGVAAYASRLDLLRLKNFMQEQYNKDGACGVYILIGKDTGSEGKPWAYIGQGEVFKRIYEHTRKNWKDKWDKWDHVAVFFRQIGNLTASQARYLESLMIEGARKAKMCDLPKCQHPPLPILSKGDDGAMRYFFDYMKLVLPAFGINIYQFTPASDDRLTKDDTVFVLGNRGAKAEAYEFDGQFFVRQGAQARVRESTSFKGGYKRLRTQLIQDKTLKRKEKHYVLSRDYGFNSTSAAASVLVGSSMQGPAEWEVKNSNLTYAAYKEKQLEQN